MARLKRVKITNDALLSIIRFVDSDGVIDENTRAAFVLLEDEKVISLYLFNPDFEENNESVVDIVMNSGENIEQIPVIVSEKNIELFKTVFGEAEKIKKSYEAEEYRKSVKVN